MSRLYGKSIEVYSISKELVETKLPKYKSNNKLTTWNAVAYAPEVLDLYLPEKAIKIIEANPIRIVNSPLVVKKTYLLPGEEKEEPTMFVPRLFPVEEYKREIVFFLGELLSNYSPDQKPTDNSIPCEFSNVIGLLLEYLYLKETNQAETFSAKHLNELLYNAKKYVKAYQKYQNIMISNNQLQLISMTEEQQAKHDEGMAISQEQFLSSTLTCLVPLSSMEGVLQIIDNYSDKEQLKKLIEELVLNEDQDRQNILSNMGIETFGYKRLRKEIERRK